MAIESLPQDVISQIPQHLLSNIEVLITILQAAGIFFIIYIGFNIINALINRKRQKDIANIKNDVSEIKNLLKKKR